MPAARRVLAAVRFVDRATARPIASMLRVSSPDADFARNRVGLWVVRAAAGVPDDPASITPLSVTVHAEVSDPSGTYLPRAFTVAVPRAPDASASLFAPVDVELPPSPAVLMRSTWAAVRVHVRLTPTAAEPDGTPVEGALVRLDSSELGLRCVTLTNHLGEALAIGHGIPRFSPGSDDTAILQPAMPHNVRIVVDPAATDFATGRRSTVADPDDLWARRASLRRRSRQVPLAVGQSSTQVFDIPRS